MSQISAAAVKQLRDRTNLPMMNCKKALTEANGDMEQAIEILRKEYAGVAIKKGARETAEGRIGIYFDPESKVGAIVEVRCESAPVAKGPDFVKLSTELAKQIALQNPDSVDALMSQPFVDDPKKTVKDRLTEAIALLQENMKVTRFHRATGSQGSYIHHDGTVGVLLEVEGDNPDPVLLKDVCMHVAATNPIAGTREDIPTATVDKEREIAQAQLDADPKNANKPANILENIITGKINKYFAENVLLEQPFVKDDTKKVGDLFKAANVKFVRFTRYRVGEVV
jgi:elongation factor Ts